MGLTESSAAASACCSRSPIQAKHTALVSPSFQEQIVFDADLADRVPEREFSPVPCVIFVRSGSTVTGMAPLGRGCRPHW